jgi:tetratricopeptide (TPR) repeat protein
MSLMNDALRKKKREDSGAQPVPEIPVPPKQGKAGRWLIIGMVSVLVGSAIFGGIALWSSTKSHFLRTNPASPAPPRGPAGAAGQTPSGVSRETTVGEQNQDAENPPASHSDPRARTTEEIVPVSVSAPSTSGIPESQRLARSTVINAGEQAANRTAAQKATQPTRMPLEGSRPEAVKAPPQFSHTIEPGPDPAVRPIPPKPAASTRLASPAPPALTVKPAAAESTDAVNITPSPPIAEADLFYQKALAYHRGGRLSEAARFYRGVLEIDADHQAAMLNLAAIYIDKGQFDQADPLLQRLTKVTPRPEGVFLNLAITALGNDRPEAALAYLDQAEAAADAPPWQIQFHRAAALARLNRLTDALALYQRIEAERPDDYRVKFNLAVTHDALGEYAQALNYYDAVLTAPDQASPSDRPSIVRRVALLRRHLGTPHSQAKRQ